MLYLHSCICHYYNLISFFFYYDLCFFSNSLLSIATTAAPLMTGTGSPLGAVVMPEVRLATDAVLLGFNVYAATAGDVEFMVGRVSFVFFVLVVGKENCLLDNGYVNYRVGK